MCAWCCVGRFALFACCMNNEVVFFADAVVTAPLSPRRKLPTFIVRFNVQQKIQNNGTQTTKQNIFFALTTTSTKIFSTQLSTTKRILTIQSEQELHWSKLKHVV